MVNLGILIVHLHVTQQVLSEVMKMAKPWILELGAALSEKKSGLMWQCVGLLCSVGLLSSLHCMFFGLFIGLLCRITWSICTFGMSQGNISSWDYLFILNLQQRFQTLHILFQEFCCFFAEKLEEKQDRYVSLSVSLHANLHPYHVSLQSNLHPNHVSLHANLHTPPPCKFSKKLTYVSFAKERIPFWLKFEACQFWSAYVSLTVNSHGRGVSLSVNLHGTYLPSFSSSFSAKKSTPCHFWTFFKILASFLGEKSGCTLLGLLHALP